MEANLGAHGANQRRGGQPTLQSEEGGVGPGGEGFCREKTTWGR